MRIMLISPPYALFTGFVERYYNIGLGSLAAVLRQDGHDVVIFEVDTLRRGTDLSYVDEYKRLQFFLNGLNDRSHWVWREVRRIIQDYGPDLIGITAVTMKFGSVLRVAEACKEDNPQVPIVVGGPHARDWPQIVLKSPFVDFNLAGEAEDSFRSLVRALESADCQYDRIPGLSYRLDGNTIVNEKGPPPRGLDDFPFPARDLLLNQSAYNSEDMGLIMTARGCPYHCTFCSHERLVRYRSVDGVIAEIKHVVETYGTKQFSFKDDAFSVNRNRIRHFCGRLKEERIKINWECTTRVDLLDEGLLETMMEAGLNVIKVGIESGSEPILNAIEKTASKDDMRRAARILNQSGVFWSAYFMYGLPDETEDDMLKTYHFMKELNPHYSGLGLYAPYPNTPLWNRGVELGLLDNETEIDHFFTTNPKDYFFKDPDHRVWSVEKQKFEEISESLITGFQRHNTAWSNLARRAWARRRTYCADPKILAADVRKAFDWLGTASLKRRTNSG